MPEILQNYAVNWYHTYLMYTGTHPTEDTISQHYYWPNFRWKLRTHIKNLRTCQKNQKKNKKYVYLLEKKVEAISRDRLLL